MGRWRETCYFRARGKDVFMVVDVPDEAAVTAVLYTVAASGVTEQLTGAPLLTAQQLDAAMEKSPSGGHMSTLPPSEHAPLAALRSFQLNIGDARICVRVHIGPKPDAPIPRRGDRRVMDTAREVSSLLRGNLQRDDTRPTVRAVGTVRFTTANRDEINKRHSRQ